MKIGLIGLEKSGKTSIFNALTGAAAATGAFGGQKAEPNLAVIAVSDPRVAWLVDKYAPKKTTYATVECVDFVGMQPAADKREIFSATDLALIRTMDALALVLRNFDDELISETYGAPDAFSELETLYGELVLADLIIAENRLERIAHNLKRGVKNAQQDSEQRALEKVAAVLNDNRPAAACELTPDELKQIRGFQFLSMKPVMAVLNSDENNFGANQELLARIEARFRAIEFAGRFEMELGQLDAEEAASFMEDMGITASARDRLTMLAYDLLGLQTFFTVGPDEVRAWTVHKGASSVEAAGVIHSDLARGFIRAECFSYDDLAAHGSEKALAEKGLVRLEGKEYTVRDGDILNIRFSV